MKRRAISIMFQWKKSKFNEKKQNLKWEAYPRDKFRKLGQVSKIHSNQNIYAYIFTGMLFYTSGTINIICNLQLKTNYFKLCNVIERVVQQLSAWKMETVIHAKIPALSAAFTFTLMLLRMVGIHLIAS